MSFLQDYESLKKTIPRPAVRATFCENSSFVDYTHNSKDCHYCFHCFDTERAIYATRCLGKDLVDCDFCIYSELCYNSVELMKCYNCQYLSHCDNCRDCMFCSMCSSCTDCFGCSGLTRKQFCIFNKQYTRSEYETKLTELKKKDPEEITEKVQKMVKETPYPQSHQRENENCPYGDYLNNSKNVYWGFSTYWVEDSGYFHEGGLAKNCWDVYYCGGGGGKDGLKGQSELCYEISGGGGLYNCAFIDQGTHCTDCFYCAEIQNCTDCFGCAGISKKKYCVLNKQLTKSEYDKTVKEIKKELGWRVS